jgi:CheY-like chemotaxis protein
MARGEPVVLVVEDNVETAAVLERLLELRNYRVVHAMDGLDALAILRGGVAPDVIVLDLWMPNVDGRAFRTALLADPALARIPIIVYSVDPGTPPVPDIVGHVRKGADTPDRLLAFIEQACGQAGHPRP